MFLGRIGAKYGKTPSQVALNWLTCQEGVIVIPKANSVEHVRENVGASGWQLSSNDFDAIGKRFA